MNEEYVPIVFYFASCVINPNTTLCVVCIWQPLEASEGYGFIKLLDVGSQASHTTSLLYYHECNTCRY